MRFILQKKAWTGSKYYKVFDEDGCTAHVRVSDHPVRFDERKPDRELYFCLDKTEVNSPSKLKREMKKIIRLVHERRNPEKVERG
jgi:hypothetical protein